MDYSGPWGKSVGHASPLPEQLNTLEEYHKRGAPRAKLLMAIPLYARTWKLESTSKQDIGDKATGGGTKGPYTDTEGILSYNELCAMIKESPNSFSLVRDSLNTAVHAIYLHGSNAEFYSFEDTKTLAIKAKNITTEGYGGVTVYTLSNEDVHGTCGKKYPLLHAIVDNYNHDAVAEVPITTIAPSVHSTETVTDPPGVFRCHSEGKYRDHLFCFKYYECVKNEFGNFDMTVEYCDRHQAWDESNKKCVDPKTISGCVSS